MGYIKQFPIDLHLSLLELRKRGRWALPVLALFLLTLLFFYDILMGNYLFIERDLAVFFIPPKFFWAESIKNGEFPLWNPYNLFGQPFFATLQPAILYPPNIMFLIFPFSIAFNWSIILHIFFGGVFIYALLRDMDANEWASFIGGLTFMFGGYLLSVHNLLSTLVSVIWVPIIILFFKRAIKGNGAKNAVLTGVFLAVSFLGGGVEIVFGCLMVLLFIIILSYTFSEKGIINAIISLAIAISVFLGLAALQIIPFLELSSHSIRAGGLNYKEAVTWSLAPWDVISFFLTDPYDYYKNTERYWANQSWLKTLYTGFLPFILMTFYFINAKRDRLLWLGIVLISLFLAFGGFNPLYYYIYNYVPFFNKLRYPVKFLYLSIFTLSITAGLGMHMLMEKVRGKKKEYFINAVFILSFISAILLIILNLGHSHIEAFLKAKGMDAPDYNNTAVNLYNAKRALFYLTLFGVILKTGDSRGWNKGITLFLSIALIGDLFGNMGYYQKMEAKEYFKPSWAIEKILSDSDMKDFRILTTPKTTNQTTFVAPYISPFDAPKQLIMPSMNLVHKIYDVQGAEVMRIKRVEEVFNTLIASPAVDATNLPGIFSIKYLISIFPVNSKEFKLFAAHTEGLEGDYKKLLEEPTIKIYKNQRFMPRAFLTENFKVLEKDEDILSAMRSKDFNPNKLAILEKEPVWDNLSQGQSKGHGVKIVENSNNRVKLKVDAKRKAMLVLTDTFYPGWKVFVNGREQKIYRADYAFRAIPISPGRSEVEYVYDPLSFKVGLAVSLFTLIVISAVGLVFVLRRREPASIKLAQTADDFN